MSQLSRWGLKNYLYLFTLSGLNWRELLKKLVHFIFVYNKYFWLVDPYRKSLYTYGGLSTLCHSCGFASQQRVLKTFSGPGYPHSEDEVVWLWHSLLNLYIYIYICVCVCVYVCVIAMNHISFNQRNSFNVIFIYASV